MKIYLFLMMLSLSAFGESAAQSRARSDGSQGKQHLAALGFYLPVGRFSNTHLAGLGIDYSRSRYRFGANVSTKPFASWAPNGGLAYHIGKQTSFNTYDFRYGGYLSIYASGGIIINPVLSGHMMLTAGPSLDVYKSSANAGARVNFSTHYFVSPLIAIGASFTYLKHSRSETILSAGLKAAYAF